MKALVLAGGLGTRLRPITHTVAKQLIPVANKPILCYGLEAIRDAAIVDVGIVVGDRAKAVRAAVGDGARFGLNITYIPQQAPQGLAHAVHVARDYLADDDFVLYLGDNIVDSGISGPVERFRIRRPDAQLLLGRVADPGAFGVAELDAAEGVVRVVEKPEQPASDHAVAGVYLFGPAIHHAIRQLRPSGRRELEITDAVQWLVDHGRRVEATRISGYWKDAGTVAGVLDANRHKLEELKPRQSGAVGDSCTLVGPVAIEAGAQVSGSRIVGPSIIGAGARVTGSSVGPFTSVAEDCVIVDSGIENSIMLAGASLRGVRRITESLIGRGAEVMPAPRAEPAHRLVLGDHSSVWLGS